MDGSLVAPGRMSESERPDHVTAHVRDGALELRSDESPGAWIVADEPVIVKQ